MRERERERERERINFSFKKKIYFLLRHIITIIIKLLRNKRFISISLPFFTNQIFYDRINKKTLNLKLETKLTMRQQAKFLLMRIIT